MADNAYFYNSQNGDRVYNADSFEKWLKKFFKTGVFSGDLFVSSGTGMRTHVTNGYCNIGGKVKIFDATELQHETANPSYNRIDLVVAERNDTERDFFLKVVTGDVASEPVAKALVRTGGIYQIALASVYIPKGSTEITQENITDLRSNTEMCGIVTGTVTEMDFSQFAAQFNAYYEQFCATNEADFNDWFATIQNTLSGDVAGNLQAQIGTLTQLQTNDKTNLVNAVNEAYNKQPDVLATKEEVQANTEAGKIADALVTKELSAEIAQISSSNQQLVDYVCAKIICTSTDVSDNGKTVYVSDGEQTWQKNVVDGSCMFTALPPNKTYTVKTNIGQSLATIFNGLLGFGDSKNVQLKLDKTTWQGLKNIVNAGMASSMLSVGDQISAVVDGETQTFDIVHINYNESTYGQNIILAKHTCLSNAMQMRTTNSNVGGYKGTIVAQYLDGEYYNSLPTDMKSVITTMTFKASIGNQSNTLQDETHKIWLPLEYNIFGSRTYAVETEFSVGGASQFEYFVSAENRKKYTDNGTGVNWWLASPCFANANATVDVNASGTVNANSSNNYLNVLPCFMIAAD